MPCIRQNGYSRDPRAQLLLAVHQTDPLETRVKGLRVCVSLFIYFSVDSGCFKGAFALYGEFPEKDKLLWETIVETLTSIWAFSVL